MSRRGLYLGPTKGALITADGNYPLKMVSGPQGTDLIDWQGGYGAFEVMGTLGAGTYKLQILGIDGASWLDIGASTSLAAAGIVGFLAPAGQLRVNVAGSTAASATVGVVGIPTNNGG